MRAVYLDDGKLELREVPAPAVSPGPIGPPSEEVRVRVCSTGICGSDLHMLAMKYPMPCVVGHEVAGVLDDGTPVAVEPLVPCTDCAACRAGDYNLCQSAAGRTLGVGRDGGMADEVRVSPEALVYLPFNVNVKDACLVEPLAVAVHGMRKAGLGAGGRFGDTPWRLAVIGGGTIGLCAVAVAKACNAMVGLSARYDHQMTAGRLLGATEVEGLYDLVVECAGTSKALDQAIKMCRPGGRVLLLGTHWEAVSYRSMLAQMKEVAIVPSYMYGAGGAMRDVDVAASLLSRNPNIARAVITHRFPLAEVEHAFEVAGDRKAGAIKVVLEP